MTSNWTTTYTPPAFVEFSTYDEEGEETKAYIAPQHMVSIEKGDGVTRICTVDGVTHYVSMNYQDVIDKLTKVFNGPH